MKDQPKMLSDIEPTYTEESQSRSIEPAVTPLKAANQLEIKLTIGIPAPEGIEQGEYEAQITNIDFLEHEDGSMTVSVRLQLPEAMRGTAIADEHPPVQTLEAQ